MKMEIQGIGAVTVWGSGLNRLYEAVQAGNVPDITATSDFPLYRIPDHAANHLPRDMRRADRFTRMAAAAALEATADCAAFADTPPERIGIVMATALGPYNTTFRFLDDVIDYGDAGASPTVFSHSVHNAAVSYIAKEVCARGPTLTLTHFARPFQQALITATAWLSQSACDVVLVGAGDIAGVVFEFLVRQKLTLATDGVLRPGHIGPPAYIPGEAFVFFVLSRNRGFSRYGLMESGTPANPAAVMCAEQWVDAESDTTFQAMPGAAVRCLAPHFGNMFISTGIHAALAAFTLRAGGGMESSRICCTRSLAGRQHHIILSGAKAS